MVKQKRGRIINIASIVGTLGLPELTAYGASKGGMITLTKCLALGGQNATSMLMLLLLVSVRHRIRKISKKTDLYKFTIERTPQGKWGLHLMLHQPVFSCLGCRQIHNR